MNFNVDIIKPNKWVKIWLWVGVGMLLVQFMLGAITRLTGSGLSITKWEIAVGSIPPINSIQWNEAFDLYKQTPQYHKINQGMSLGEFKFIYLWEFSHRLWARTLGFVFIIPFFIFLFKRKLSKPLIKDLIIIVLLGGLVGIFGWIMVASGLVNRPWVNAYKLTLHLNLAFLVYGYLLWTALKYSFPERIVVNNTGIKMLLNVMFVCLMLQLIFGGIMSGMKAGLFFPTWPSYSGDIVPAILLDGSSWKLDHLRDYDSYLFSPALIQFIHRNLAYLILGIGIVVYLKLKKTITEIVKYPSLFFLGILIIQVILGILTLLNSKGQVPVLLGVLHQSGAILLLTAVLLLHFRVRYSKSLINI